MVEPSEDNNGCFLAVLKREANMIFIYSYYMSFKQNLRKAKLEMIISVAHNVQYIT